MAEIKIQFNEEDLKKYLIKNISKHYPNFKVIAEEYPVPDGRIDLLCKITDEDDTYVVIELKQNNITNDSLSQVLRYTQYMNNEQSKNGKRRFYPLLIGQNLQDEKNHLQKLLKSYNGGFYHNFLCFYNLFSFDVVNMDFVFTYVNSYNEQYIDNNYNTIFNYEDKVLEELDEMNFKNYNLIKELEKCKN